MSFTMPTFGCPEDWIYKDIHWTTQELLTKMLERAGAGEYKMLAYTATEKDGVLIARGQAMFSPVAIKNLLEYLSEIQEDS